MRRFSSVDVDGLPLGVPSAIPTDVVGTLRLAAAGAQTPGGTTQRPCRGPTTTALRFGGLLLRDGHQWLLGDNQKAGQRPEATLGRRGNQERLPESLWNRTGPQSSPGPRAGRRRTSSTDHRGSPVEASSPRPVSVCGPAGKRAGAGPEQSGAQSGDRGSASNRVSRTMGSMSRSLTPSG